MKRLFFLLISVFLINSSLYSYDYSLSQYKQPDGSYILPNGYHTTADLSLIDDLIQQYPHILALNPQGFSFIHQVPGHIIARYDICNQIRLEELLAPLINKYQQYTKKEVVLISKNILEDKNFSKNEEIFEYTDLIENDKNIIFYNKEKDLLKIVDKNDYINIEYRYWFKYILCKVTEKPITPIVKQERGEKAQMLEKDMFNDIISRLLRKL